MKKVLLLSALLLVSFGCIKSQTVTYQEAIGYGIYDVGTSVIQTNDSGYIICGKTIPQLSPWFHIFLIKLNSAGDTLWTKVLTTNINGENIEIESSRQTNDNGFILFGSLSYGNHAGIYCLKLDPLGNIQWQSIFRKSAVTVWVTQFGTCVYQTSDGGYIASGTSQVWGPDTMLLSEAFLVKTNAIGDTLWIKSYGGTYFETGNSVIQTANNGYILAGSTSETTHSFVTDSLDVFIVRTNSGGDTLWSKRYGGNDNEWANSIQQSNDNGYIIAGTTTSFGAGNKDIYLIRTDANGNVMWSKTYGGAGDEEGNSVQLTDDGGYIITGSTTSFGAGSTDAYLIKTDSSGNLIWSKTFGEAGGTNEGLDVKQTNNGGFVLTGSSFSVGGYLSVLYIKTDEQGISTCNQVNPATITTSVASQSFRVAPVVSIGGWYSVIPDFLIPPFRGGTITNCLPVSIDEASSDPDNISIFPNPTSGNFTINLVAEIQKGNLEIYNMQGEMIFKKQIANQSKIDISLKSVSAGIYLLKLSDHEKQYSHKFIIE
jgi:hypothetical protein